MSGPRRPTRASRSRASSRMRRVCTRIGSRSSPTTRAVTYAELEARSRELARALIGAGVVKGARVAVWMANSPEWIVAAYAVGSVGAVLVPVNTFASAVRARLHPAPQRCVGALDAARARQAAVPRRPAREPSRDRARSARPAARAGAAAPAARGLSRRSSRRAAASRAGRICSPAAATSPTRCSTRCATRWSPPTTA